LRLIFASIQHFLFKASGWPSSVLKPENPELEEKLKKHFIERNQKEYGIKLEPSRIAKNEGLRYLAKTCNNSMYEIS